MVLWLSSWSSMYTGPRETSVMERGSVANTGAGGVTYETGVWRLVGVEAVDVTVPHAITYEL